ncbi:MAG: alpha-glucuronidase [Ruminococcus sp.]|jgi:alpha-glucuronidase|nr:alpha-glucuronidase [Ruminococcus sp.]
MFLYRVINHWDNMDGSVERGYAGRSIFFEGNRFLNNFSDIKKYASYLQSININTICLNNVNVNEVSAKLITEEFLPDLAKVADIFRQHGIKLLIAIEFSAPKSLGGLDSCDPLDKSVCDWWKKQTDLIYKYIPDLAGFLVKADSEFRDGPAALGRTQADGANCIARPLAPHDGVVFWRCFVYNCRQDWRDTKTDRAKAAYETFMPLDGQFDDNVILQIKNGPMDFQVREPLSPLLGNMKNTRQALELQITQEYTGQQIDIFSLASQWEDYFNSPINATEILADKKFDAICGVANVGRDTFLCGNPLAEANLFAFGKFGDNPYSKACDIINEWTDDQITREILMKSRDAYEGYTTPLGLGWMVTPHFHYGISPLGYEFDKWGTYHRASHTHIGVDRSTRGTGFVSQYDPYLTELYDNPETTPEELLLFFHRLPYTYKMKDGRTLLEYLYDRHFEGYEAVESFIELWKKSNVNKDIYDEVARRLELQKENAREWRDVFNTFLYRMTGVCDEKGRKIYD